jgi:hypothetical protein
MSAETSDNYLVAFPPNPSPGSSGVLIPEKCRREIAELENARQVRLWTVRAVISDHVPLAGTIDSVLSRPSHHSLVLNENPLTIYVHRGGLSAVYFDLYSGPDNRLSHIDVRVETDLPDRAILLAWEPFGALLDGIARNYFLPLVISRLELLSPTTGEAIAYNLILPNAGGLSIGPLGGIQVEPAFVPIDAIWREALNSSSPFYRLLCAYRIEDATTELRRVMRASLKRLGLDAKLPPETKIDAAVLGYYGMSKEEIGSLQTVRDLFDHFRSLRNAIAHFLVSSGVEDEKKAHALISDGMMIRTYSVASAALLSHVQIRLSALRTFFNQHGLTSYRGGSILPMPENKLAFPVRDPLLTRLGSRPIADKVI